jgi:hypothetical protein
MFVVLPARSPTGSEASGFGRVAARLNEKADISAVPQLCRNQMIFSYWGQERRRINYVAQWNQSAE